MNKNSPLDKKLPEKEEDAPPPILKTWTRLYWFVLLLHAVFLSLFYWFTKSYA
jgi:hypothetical protein